MDAGCRGRMMMIELMFFLTDAVRQENQIRRLLFAFSGEVPSAA